MPRTAVVLDEDGTVRLELSDVTPLVGRPTAGYVVNGAWYWRYIDGRHYALRRKEDALDQAVTVYAESDFSWLGVRSRIKYGASEPVGSEYLDSDIPF